MLYCNRLYVSDRFLYLSYVLRLPIHYLSHHLLMLFTLMFMSKLLIDFIFFFIRPILPNEVIAYNEGLALKARIYNFMIPWDQIRLIEHASTSEAMGKMALRIASAPSRSVKMYLVGHKLPVIFSIADESRLINEWKQRTKRVQHA